MKLKRGTGLRGVGEEWRGGQKGRKEGIVVVSGEWVQKQKQKQEEDHDHWWCQTETETVSVIQCVGEQLRAHGFMPLMYSHWGLCSSPSAYNFEFPPITFFSSFIFVLFCFFFCLYNIIVNGKWFFFLFASWNHSNIWVTFYACWYFFSPFLLVKKKIEHSHQNWLSENVLLLLLFVIHVYSTLYFCILFTSPFNI